MKVGNDSNSSTGPICHDLSDVAEGDNESRTSTASNVDGPLRMSQASRASSSRSGRSKKRSSNRGPSIMSEISNWSASNPYGEDSNHNLNEEGNAGDQADDTDRQRSGSSVDVAEMEALHDSVDFSL
jgi:hypothetical protein